LTIGSCLSSLISGSLSLMAGCYYIVPALGGFP
jgi:hypothetical protein